MPRIADAKVIPFFELTKKIAEKSIFFENHIPIRETNSAYGVNFH
jgi:hypothetical protein